MNDDAWAEDFLRGLRRDLRVAAKDGAWAVERAEVVDGSLVTVLTETASGRRYGRTIGLATLRAQFSPDLPDIVSAGWFFTFFPPRGWDDLHVVEGTCWFGGQRP